MECDLTSESLFVVKLLFTIEESLERDLIWNKFCNIIR